MSAARSESAGASRCASAAPPQDASTRTNRRLRKPRTGLEDRCCRCALRSDRPTHCSARRYRIGPDHFGACVFLRTCAEGATLIQRPPSSVGFCPFDIPTREGRRWDRPTCEVRLRAERRAVACGAKSRSSSSGSVEDGARLHGVPRKPRISRCGSRAESGGSRHSLAASGAPAKIRQDFSQGILGPVRMGARPIR
jgi:hypothetical protein